MSNTTSIKICKIESNATIPKHSGAGYDLYSAYNYIIPPNSKITCFTNLKIIIPEGYYGKIIQTDELYNTIKIVNNTGITSYFRDNVSIELQNTNGYLPVFITTKHPIAHLICIKIEDVTLELY
jgi:dUTP pyrophosphatase